MGQYTSLQSPVWAVWPPRVDHGMGTKVCVGPVAACHSIDLGQGQGKQGRESIERRMDEMDGSDLLAPQ